MSPQDVLAILEMLVDELEDVTPTEKIERMRMLIAALWDRSDIGEQHERSDSLPNI